MGKTRNAYIFPLGKPLAKKNTHPGIEKDLEGKR
jgi:hypothetical protein